MKLRRIFCARSLRFVLLLTLLVVVSSGCIATGSPRAGDSLGSMRQRRSIETKILQGDFEHAYRAIVSVLQDYGYIIKTAEYDSGLIFAHTGSQGATPRDIEERGGSVSQQNINVFLEPYGEDKVRIRITLMQHIDSFSKRGVVSRDVRVENPQVLQRMFADFQREIVAQELGM